MKFIYLFFSSRESGPTIYNSSRPNLLTTFFPGIQLHTTCFFSGLDLPSNGHLGPNFPIPEKIRKYDDTLSNTITGRYDSLLHAVNVYLHYTAWITVHIISYT